MGGRRPTGAQAAVPGAVKPTGPQRPVERPYAAGGPATRRPDPAHLTRPIKQPRVGSQPSVPSAPAAAPLHLPGSNPVDPLEPSPSRVPFGGALPVKHRTHMNVVTRVFQESDLDADPLIDGEGTDEHQIEFAPAPEVLVVPQANQARVAAAPAPAPAPAPRQRVPTLAHGQSSAPVAPSPSRENEAKGTVIAFFSCRGGAGTTTLAVNTAAVLARTGASVCLVDLDLQLGEALTFLNIEPTVPLSALARDSKNVDWEMVAPRLARHHSGLCGLAQTGHLEDLRELEPTRIPLLLHNLRRQFSVVIVDGLRDFNDHALAALDTADRVLLVATQDVPAIRGAARRAAIFRRLGYAADKFLLVLNRFDRKSAVSPTLVAEEIGLTPTFTIANDFETVSQAINAGCPLQEIDADAAVTREIAEMTRRLFGLPAQEQRSVWSRLFGRKKK